MVISVLSSGNDVYTYTELTDDAMAKCGSAYCPAQLVSASNITETASCVTVSPENIENANFNTDITKIYIIAGIYISGFDHCFLLLTLLPGTEY
jgi:hypothetical protein